MFLISSTAADDPDSIDASAFCLLAFLGHFFGVSPLAFFFDVFTSFVVVDFPERFSCFVVFEGNIRKRSLNLTKRSKHSLK